MWYYLAEYVLNVFEDWYANAKLKYVLNTCKYGQI